MTAETNAEFLARVGDLNSWRGRDWLPAHILIGIAIEALDRLRVAEAEIVRLRNQIRDKAVASASFQEDGHD